MDGDGLLEIGRDVTLEAVTEAELAAEEEYEERCRARQQAEDDWVDAVVQDQERRAEAKRRAAAAGAAAPSLADDEGDRAAELLHQARATCSLLAEAAPKLAGEGSSASPYVQPDFAARLLAALSTNAHTLCDEELQPVGIGLYPLAALTNHACEPSAVQVFDGPDLVLRALRLLKEGEAVTISYVDVAQSPAARRAELSAGYYFACACPRCEREAAPATEAALSGAGSELAQARSRVLAAIDESRWGDALADARVCCRLCDQLLPGGMPSAGIEKLRLAKLLSHQGHLGEALHAWKAARAILSITHGEDAPLVRAITSDVNAAAAEIDFKALEVN